MAVALTAAAIAVAAGIVWWLIGSAPDEARAVQMLRTIYGAQVAYFDRCDGYAPSLIELVRAGDFPSHHVGAEGTLAQSGYRAAVAPSTGAAAVSNGWDGCGEAVTDYFAHADPVRGGRARHFAIDSGGTIVQARQSIANPIPSTAEPLTGAGR